MKPLCKVLDEGTAACRARLVERDIADTAVLHKEALHILTAYVQKEFDAGNEKVGGAIMGDRFDFARINIQRRLKQRFAVTGRNRARNIYRFRQKFVQIF